MINQFTFSFSDLISGYVSNFNPADRRITLRTSDERT